MFADVNKCVIICKHVDIKGLNPFADVNSDFSKNKNKQTCYLYRGNFMSQKQKNVMVGCRVKESTSDKLKELAEKNGLQLGTFLTEVLERFADNSDLYMHYKTSEARLHIQTYKTTLHIRNLLESVADKLIDDFNGPTYSGDKYSQKSIDDHGNESTKELDLRKKIDVRTVNNMSWIFDDSDRNKV